MPDVTSSGCVVCGAPVSAESETAEVACNVRRFRDQRFAVWRCRACRSIHARGEVALATYYEDYPFARGTATRVNRYLCGRLWRRVASAKVAPGASVLDYGCGAGLLVSWLRERGLDAEGYDAYTAAFARPELLTRSYDVVLAQDVIEHVDAPLALLDELIALCRPGGLLAIGTPDALAIDLAETERWKHSLHQPYHRHILSSTALLEAAAARGLALVRYYPRSHLNTPIPTLNQPYLLRYLRAIDDTVDAAFDPPALRLAMLSPAALWDALFGALRGPASDGLAVFRRAGDVEGAAAPPSGGGGAG